MVSQASSISYYESENNIVTSHKAKNYEESFYKYLRANCTERLHEILQADETDRDYFPIIITYIELFNEDPLLGNDLLLSPAVVLKSCDIAANKALVDHFESVRGDTSSASAQRHWNPSKSIHVRISSLPDGGNPEFPTNKDVGIFTSLRGTVIRTKAVKLLKYSKPYKCSKCKKSFFVEVSQEFYNEFPKVVRCQNGCESGKVTPIEEESSSKSGLLSPKFRDYQEIKIQEQDQKLQLGAMPKCIWVVLDDDLVDLCKPGDDVYITGAVIRRWRALRPGQLPDADIALVANHLTVNNDQRAAVLITDENVEYFKKFWAKYKDDPFSGRNHILSSFCPGICGMYVVKLAMCVVLTGGVSKQNNGTNIRGESHLLLVGDPGTGKSQLLKYASKLCPRSVLTTGVGTTNAGLTVSAVKDGGEWHLEAGALVLADGGVCCIDEFSCIKEQDRTSIHEAMEQQSISVAKAGMVCKLNTRCTILASTNPKGKYDPNQSLSLNVALASPLLSRFDILLVLVDAQHPAWDSLVSDFILRGESEFNRPSRVENPWDIDMLQAYMVLAKDIKPAMSQEAYKVLCEYYQLQRKSATRNVARTTVRLFESLVRLSEGHARLMHRETVELYDAVTAVTLMECSMLGSSLMGESSSLHTAFPSDPMHEYYTQAQAVLSKLELPTLWAEEAKYLKRLKRRKVAAESHEESQPSPEQKRSRFLLEQQQSNGDDDNDDDGVRCHYFGNSEERIDEDED